MNWSQCWILSLVFILSCSSVQRTPSSEDGTTEDRARDELSNSESGVFTGNLKRHTAFFNLVERNLSFRSRAINFFNDNECLFNEKASRRKCKEVKSNMPISADLGSRLYAGIESYIDLRTELYRTIQGSVIQVPLDLAKKEAFVFESTEEKFSVEPRRRHSANHFSDELVFKYKDRDPETREYFTNLKYAVAGGLMLYDNYMLAIQPYYENKKLAYLINTDFKTNHPDQLKIPLEFCPAESKRTIKTVLDRTALSAKEKQEVLTLVTDDFYEECRRQLMSKALKLLQAESTWRSEHQIEVTDEEHYLDALIEESFLFNETKKGHFKVDTKDRVWDLKIEKYRRNFDWYARIGTYFASKTFGNIMGMYQERSGKLKSLSLEEKKDLASRLKSMDILFEKTPFRLTDRFIPGYYGHVAIWVGTEQELKDLGVWDSPEVKPFQKMIQSGHHIIEALRPGVEINTLDHFLDIDDFLAVRNNNLTVAEKQELVLRAFRQVGKEYDFNFDVETKNRIVCSEIVYAVYEDYEWPTDKTIGRSTISPDHVAWKAEGGCFEPVAMYVDGQKIHDDGDGVSEKLKRKLNSLLNGQQGIRHTLTRGCGQRRIQ